MAIKSVSIRIEEEMLEKLGFVADYEGRSVNSHILVLIRENIKKFEEQNDVHKHIVCSTNHTHGSATPLPHILYSALSEYGSFSHFATCLSDFILQPVTSA